MKNYILLFALLLSFMVSSKAQMTLVHSFPKQYQTESEIVDLSISGKKIMTVSNQNGNNQADTIYFYNMDYSYWKSIPCPAVPGYAGQFNILHDVGEAIGIYYPSETLFNLDPLLEVAVFYNDSIHPLTSAFGKFYIINETGTIVDSILNAVYGYPFEVFKVDTLGIGFQAVVTTTTNINIYNLPGTLPCDACSGSLGIAKTEEKHTNILSNPIPNPSKSDVKITFTLPEGATRGELTIYNTTGQLMKSYTVDNRFGFIIVDDSQFAPGMYYYNLTVNGTVSSSQKMVVIK